MFSSLWGCALYRLCALFLLQRCMLAAVPGSVYFTGHAIQPANGIIKV